MIANCLHLLFELAGSPSSVKRGSPVSVYLFPGEGPKSCTSALEGEDSELDQLVVTATEVHADMMSEECSEGSTDNDDFCILEAPGIGIPVSAVCSDYFCSSLLSYMDFDTLLSSVSSFMSSMAFRVQWENKESNRSHPLFCFSIYFTNVVLSSVSRLKHESTTWILFLSLSLSSVQPKDGEPVVKVLSQSPIKVRDGYFSRPRGSSDLLRAPARFPMPQSRVVLREVSVVWHLYGGKDFGGKTISAHTQHSQRWRNLVNYLTYA